MVEETVITTYPVQFALSDVTLLDLHLDKALCKLSLLALYVATLERLVKELNADCYSIYCIHK